MEIKFYNSNFDISSCMGKWVPRLGTRGDYPYKNSQRSKVVQASCKIRAKTVEHI